MHKVLFHNVTNVLELLFLHFDNKKMLKVILANFSSSENICIKGGCIKIPRKVRVLRQDFFK